VNVLKQKTEEMQKAALKAFVMNLSLPHLNEELIDPIV